MDTFICSDLHGRLDTWNAIKEQIGQNKLYILGDVIDRNPGGAEILLDIIDRDNVTLLLGNHEWMMYHSLFDDRSVEYIWLSQNNGGQITKRAIEKAINENRITMDKLRLFLEGLPVYIDFGDTYLCHGFPPFTEYKEKDEKPHGSWENPISETMKNFYDKNGYNWVHHIVWDSIFKNPYLICEIEDSRDISTTVYCGHVIKDYAITNKYTPGELPLKQIDNVTFIDIDGGCAFPQDGSYGGHCNLLNLTKGTKTEIEIFRVPD